MAKLMRACCLKGASIQSMDGKGKVTFKDGTVKQGKWKDNAYWYAALIKWPH